VGSIFGGATLPYAFALNPVATTATGLISTGIGLGVNSGLEALTGKNAGQWLNTAAGIDPNSPFGYIFDPTYMASGNRFARMVRQSALRNV